MQLLWSDTAREAAEALDGIAAGKDKARPSDRFFGADHGAVWNELASGGWLELGLDERRGGAGLHLVDLALIVETWGRYLVPVPFVPTMLVRRWAEGATDVPRNVKLSYALPEGTPGAASAGRALAPFVGPADVGLVTRLSPLTHVAFESIPVPPGADSAVADVARNRSGNPRSDHAPSLPLARVPQATAGLPAQAALEIALLGAAELIGCGSSVLKVSVEYAQERKQFGQAIAEFQAIQHRLANMHRDIEVARTALIWAANEPERVWGALRIVWDRIRAASENAFQIHGGFGFTWEAGVHFYSRHIWAMGRLLAATGVRLWPG